VRYLKGTLLYWQRVFEFPPGFGAKASTFSRRPTAWRAGRKADALPRHFYRQFVDVSGHGDEAIGFTPRVGAHFIKTWLF
jgi:hypothetical protein